MSISLPGSGEVTRLTLLSLLSLGPSHGYGLRETIETWRMDKWANIRYGSIYQVLERMERDGLVEQAEVSREGKRPVRTRYAITEAGGEELRNLLRRAWSEPSQYAQPVNVALSFYLLQFLPAEEVAALLTLRLEQLGEAAAEVRAEEEKSLATFDTPGLNACLADHFDHFHRLLATEQAWTAHVLRQVQAGAYDTAAPASDPEG
jgi:DNA-binding PadR family transcriptional regulator